MADEARERSIRRTQVIEEARLERRLKATTELNKDELAKDYKVLRKNKLIAQARQNEIKKRNKVE